MTNGNPYDKAHELARAMKDSAVFRRYAAAQNELSQNPEALELVKEFRKRQLAVDQAEILGQKPAEVRAGDLALEYVHLNEEAVIAEYFEAEGMFVQMYNDIQQIIQEDLGGGFGE